MTLFAFSTDGTTVTKTRNLPEPTMRRVDTGQWVAGLTATTAESILNTVGVYVVNETPPPADPDTEWLPTYTRNADRFDQGWTAGRDLTAQNAEVADKQAKRLAVENAVATLRAWADDAEATTVTSGNAVATLQTVVDRLGVFFDRFADMVESRDYV